MSIHEAATQRSAAATESVLSTSRESALSQPPKILTAADVAALLRVAPPTIYKLKTCDGLPYHKFGGSVRFYLDEVLAWMADQPSSS